ncbi:MAG: TRAP transporter small permease [Proteobacteria bacterium]|nr:TRAP transporter small permease [Pseudomonadota bacterium]
MERAQAEAAETGQSTAHQPVVSPNVAERTMEFTCFAALMVMFVLTVIDIVTRAAMNYSLEISDEIGGYMLVVMMFCSLGICHVSDCFHRVELIVGRFSPRNRALALIVYELTALAFSIILTWQFVRLIRNSLRSGEDSGSLLMTPLWLPRLALPIGTAILCLSLLRTISARIRTLPKRSGPGAAA